MGDDLDAFGWETRVRSAARAAASDEAPVTPAEPAYSMPLALVYASRKGGLPHMVSMVDDPRGKRLSCTCKSAAVRGSCWAGEEARRLLGWPELDSTAERT